MEWLKFHLEDPLERKDCDKEFFDERAWIQPKFLSRSYFIFNT